MNSDNHIKRAPKDNKEENNPWNDYLKYSGIAFQMVAVIGLCVWGGIVLDQKLNTSPLFVLVLAFLGIFLSLFTLYKSLPKD